jgi:hypothetical protein
MLRGRIAVSSAVELAGAALTTDDMVVSCGSGWIGIPGVLDGLTLG